MGPELVGKQLLMWLEVEERLGKFVPAAHPRGKPSVEHRARDAVRDIVREACGRLLSTLEVEAESEVA